ncbi:hypothetical protein YC2023_094258 [Brassica napus]
MSFFTEVVQEACFSSESDSDHNEIDCLVRKTKKKTLNLAHALEVDRKIEVLVRSIIPQDPKRLVDESLFVLADEVTDIKVEKLLRFIHANDVFSKDMFKGGETKFDVEKMREQSKAAAKKKQPINKQTPTVVFDEARVSSIFISVLKPKLHRVDGNVASALATVKYSAFAYKDYDVAAMEAMFKAFKAESFLPLPPMLSLPRRHNILPHHVEMVARPVSQDMQTEVVVTKMIRLSKYHGKF